MLAAYNSQSAPGGTAVNPVLTPGLASPAPLLLLKTKLLHLLSTSQSESNFEIFDKNLQLRYLTPFSYHTHSLSCPEHFP
jgi:hypothetical protein